MSEPGKEDTRTPAEREYDETVAACVLKPEGHVERVYGPNESEKHLYAVTTLAASPKYGGTRTPVICDSFAKACDFVERNVGDLWEYSYMLCVIEAIVPNRLYSSSPEDNYWYVWTWAGGADENGSYKAIETPEIYKCMFGFGVG